MRRRLARSVGMAVMSVRIVRMGMPQRRVGMPMTVRLAGRVVRSMLVPMVGVVPMPVRMLHGVVSVLVGMPLG